MRRIFLMALVCFAASAAFAQNDSTARQNVLKTAGAANRSGDHFMLQLGYTMWQGKPDSINTSGFPRSFNAYLMFDFPFKTNPKMSVALGPGISTDNIFFENTRVGIADRTSTLQFTDLSDTNSFKKYKLTTAWLEAPIELRFSSRPNDPKRSFKVAVGAKIATLLSATTKGKNLQDRNDNAINDYTEKIKSKNFFNRNRLSLTGRVGFGNFSLFAAYSVTPLFKEGLAPTIRPLTIGLTLSGL